MQTPLLRRSTPVVKQQFFCAATKNAGAQWLALKQPTEPPFGALQWQGFVGPMKTRRAEYDSLANGS